MKRTLFIIILLIIMVGIIVACVPREIDTSEYLRIHIRANSNSEIDQDVKYKIKGEVVKMLSPKLEGVKSSEVARQIVLDNIDNINNAIDEVLISENLPYRSNVVITREHFPLRHYGNVTLEEGVYDAVIVNLGKGKGDNWWCVVFQPLCFVEAESIGEKDFRYVSRIAEIIDKWRRS